VRIQADFVHQGAQEDEDQAMALLEDFDVLWFVAARDLQQHLVVPFQPEG